MKVFAEEFLEQPDLFPGRIAGEEWGEEEVSLDLAGGPYRLMGLSLEQKQSVEERFPSRVQPTASIDFLVRVFRIEPSEFRTFSLTGWNYTIDFDHQPDRVRMAGLDLLGVLELEQVAPSKGGASSGNEETGAESEAGANSSKFRSRSAALWTPEHQRFATSGVLENFLRVLVSYRLLALGGVMLHSAAVVRDGRAHVFVGHSGAGKSTLSKISLEAGHQILSDDVNTLLPDLEGGGILVEQIPFAGDFGHDRLVEGSFPLAALFRLEQSAKHALNPLTLADTIGLLLANSPFVNCDEHRLDCLLEVLLDLATGTAAHRLSFRRDAGFWDILPR